MLAAGQETPQLHKKLCFVGHSRSGLTCPAIKKESKYVNSSGCANSAPKHYRIRAKYTQILLYVCLSLIKFSLKCCLSQGVSLINFYFNELIKQTIFKIGLKDLYQNVTDKHPQYNENMILT